MKIIEIARKLGQNNLIGLLSDWSDGNKYTIDTGDISDLPAELRATMQSIEEQGDNYWYSKPARGKRNDFRNGVKSKQNNPSIREEANQEQITKQKIHDEERQNEI